MRAIRLVGSIKPGFVYWKEIVWFKLGTTTHTKWIFIIVPLRLPAAPSK